MQPKIDRRPPPHSAAIGKETIPAADASCFHPPSRQTSHAASGHKHIEQRPRRAKDPRRRIPRWFMYAATCRPIPLRPECHRLVRWSLLRSPRPAGESPPAGMPPACPVVAYARRYPPANPLRPECHRLVRVVAYARRYVPANPLRPECHRLVRWSLTLAATRRPIPSGPNATGSSGGRLRSPLPAGQSPPARMPPACPVVAYVAATRRPFPSGRNATGLSGWSSLRSPLPAGQSPPAGMPPACPLVAHARRYPPANPLRPECHRLVRWSLTLAATRRPIPPAGMPPACPVVAYARRYPPANPLRPECHRLVRWSLTLAATRRPIPSGRNATGLSGGRWPPLPAGQSPPAGMPPACPVVAYARRYPPANPLRPECHRLVRWSLTLAATRRPIPSGRNATGLSGGRLRLPLPAGQSPPAGMPPACPVVAYARRYPPANPLAPDEQRRDPTGRIALVFLRAVPANGACPFLPR